MSLTSAGKRSCAKSLQQSVSLGSDGLKSESSATESLISFYTDATVALFASPGLEVLALQQIKKSSRRWLLLARNTKSTDRLGRLANSLALCEGNGL